MRRLLMVSVIAAMTGFLPAIAAAGNQETAEKIAASMRAMRDSGQLSDFKVNVKFQDGTAWLGGRVANQDQMNRALKLAFQTPGVERVVNNLKIGSDATNAVPAATGQTAKAKAANPLRRIKSPATSNAQSAVAMDSSPWTQGGYATSNRAVPVSMNQAIPAPPTQPAPLPANGSESPVSVPSATGVPGGPLPMYAQGGAAAPAPARYDQPCMPNYAWPSYAAYPNYAAVTYPKQYSPTAWPYIGPFYPYPQVPLGWRKVTLEWDNGWWFLDFKDQPCTAWWR